MNQSISTHLPIGTMLTHYKITKVLGKGGFGVTYLAENTRLKQLVAIKEYFPTEMGVRAQDSISLKAHSEKVEDYQYGLKSFLSEAQVLAQFKHPNIVRVSDYLELNGTAYMIMDFEAGEDLSKYLKRTNFEGNMPETELKNYMLPILKGLQAVHEKELLHRDIKPGNIYLRKDAEPMLIDFGAARYALGEHSKSMSAIISMGYAPPEQYSSTGKQNQASDIYAWGATAYQLITGKAPIESPDRLNAIFEDGEDLLTPISQTHAGKYSKDLLATIDACLQVSNKNRPQSVVEVIAMLKGEKLKIDKTEIVDPKQRFKNTHSETGTKYVKPEERFANTRPENNRHSSKSTSVIARERSDRSNLLKYAMILFILTGISAGSYYGYNYYQQTQLQAQQQKIAQEKQKQEKIKAEQQRQKQAQFAKEKNKQIQQAQGYLSKLGYKIPQDGNLNSRTIESIKDFEKKQNLVVTGNVDAVLLEELEKAYAIKDKQAWDKAQGNIKKLQSYARDYPDGQYSNQVNVKIQQIKQAQAEKAEQQRLAKLAAEKEKQRQAKLAAEKEKQRQAKLAAQAEAEAERQRLAKIEAQKKAKAKKIADRLALGENGTILDKSNNLMWMRCSLGQTWNKTTANCDGDASEFTWKDAMVQAKASSYAGFNDWRVPTIEELETLVYCSTSRKPRRRNGRLAGCTKGYTRPIINKSQFPNTPTYFFWSSSPNANTVGDAWILDFGDGEEGYTYRNGSTYVRLVRDEQ